MSFIAARKHPRFQYGETAAQVIIVVVTVMAIDMFSARLRKALI